jgi:hypothetical protein
MVCDQGREPVILVDQVEGPLVGGGADQRLDVAVARAHRAGELRQPRIGLDRDAVPALEIECERHVVVDGMARADVDVESVRAVAEAAHEVEVLEALGVGDRN